MSDFSLQILSPEREVLSCRAQSLSLRLCDGEICVLPGHADLVSPIAICRMSLLCEGKLRQACLTEGVLIIKAGKVTILAGALEWREDIDIERARRALARAEKRVAETQMSWERERAMVGMERAKNRLAFAQNSLEG